LAARLGDGPTAITIIADSVTVTSSGKAAKAAGSGGGAPGARSGGGGAAAAGAPAAAPAAPAAPPPDGHINLSIEDAAGGEVRFLVPVSTPLHTLLDLYCTRRGVPRGVARFLGARGGRLNPALTVRAAGLRERDVIVMERTDGA
jgi:hypothetical protein